jgi:DNA-binding FadR family transcriptional regulator
MTKDSNTQWPAAAERVADHRNFQPVRVGRSHEYVGEQIRRQIALRLIPPQGALPPERELARMLGVGRATVQQAIRLLEREGLLVRRRGRFGGTFVLGPTGDEESLEDMIPKLRRNAEQIEEALAYRDAVEPAAARLAAMRRTPVECTELRRIHGEGVAERGNAEILAKDADFHLIIGRMSRNRFLADGVEAARLALADALFALPESQVWTARSDHEHARILAAIEESDPVAADRSMRRHVESTADAVRALLRAL